MKKYFLLLCLFSTIIQAQQNLWWMSNKSRVNPELPYGSVAFNGVNQSITASGSGNFDPSSSTWTLEYWMYCSGTISSYVVGKLADGTESFYIQCLGTSWKIGDTADKLTCTQTLATNTWHHIALVCNSGTLKFYINGTQVATGANTLVSNTIANFTIGARSAAFMNGNVSSFRLVTGTAVYTTTPFSLPTNLPSALDGTQLLLKTSYTTTNIFTDSSLNTFTITNNNTATSNKMNPFVGNDFFNTIAYLNATLTAAQTTGTSPFTMECWFYLDNFQTSGNQCIFNFGGVELFVNGGSNATGKGNIGFSNSTGTTNNYISKAGAIKQQIWYHAALIRDATNKVYLYLNGEKLGESNIPANLTTTVIYIGARNGSNIATSYRFAGLMTSLRYTKEVVYTSDFIPAVAPLEITPNTVFYIPMSYGVGIKDYSSNKVPIGNSSVSTDPRNPFGI